MNVSGDTKIYRKDFNGRPSYSRCIASQEYKDGQKGDWIRAYEPVQFPKDTNIPDRCMVRITKAFEATYKGKNGPSRKLVVREYQILDAPTNTAQNGDFGGSDGFGFGFDGMQADDTPF